MPEGVAMTTTDAGFVIHENITMHNEPRFAGLTVTPEPTMAFKTGGNVRVAWKGHGWTLLAAKDMVGPWSIHDDAKAVLGLPENTTEQDIVRKYVQLLQEE